MRVMTERATYLADTYALIEIVRGNSSYLKYKSCTLVTTQLNLMEVYYHFLRDCDQSTADRYFGVFSELVMPITDSCIKSGMRFKLMNRKEKLSYVDCVGYAYAVELSIKFLTGDKKFKNKENVEFVR
jgi:predicted nucleic acid-binding protein